jgi:nickel transport system permease protein
MKTLRKLLRNRTVLVAALLIGILLALALAAPVLTHFDPNEVILDSKLLGPSSAHLLGTDHLGRDILARLIFGARVSLGSVSIILVLVLAVGFLVGASAGFFGGAIDATLMRICDIFMTFPTFILAMFMVGVLGTGLFNVILAIVMTHWAWYARIIRGFVLSLKDREYVLAAKVAGTPRLKILRRHILPPIVAQLLILATLDIGHMMLHVSALSFLGLGVAPPTPEWGVMINDARQFMWTNPYLILLPGAMVFVTVMAFNLLGDAIRDELDPEQAGLK